MLCFDEPIKLQGNSGTINYQEFVIQFEYCNQIEREYECNEFQQNRAYMSGKSLIMLTNQRVIKDLDTDVNSSEDFNIEESSRVLWTPFDT